jgi:hypothetical protein
MARWEHEKAEIWRQHEADLAAAQQAHANNLDRLQKEWQKEKEEVELMNDVRLKEAESHHLRMVSPQV